MSEAQMAVKLAMEHEAEMFIVLGVTILLVGIWLGYVIRRWSWIPRTEARKGYAVGCLLERGRAGQVSRPYDAPVPVDLGYDPENPMNAGRKRETVRMCGAEWYRMN